MNNPGFAKRILVLGCLLACQQTVMAADEILSKAKERLDGRQAQEAYGLLAPLESQRAGDQEYDYLLGIAALESGKLMAAIFAFERVLALNPSHADARMGLARAYYMTGETKASRAEFETLKRQQPADQANRITEEYLRSIDKAAAGTTVRGYVEVSIGYDDNINSATSAGSVYFAASDFTLALERNFRRRTDQFGAIAAGIHVRHAVSADWAINGTANIGQRINDSVDDFNIGYLDTSLGMTHTRGDNQFTAALQYQKINVHNHAFRHAYGVLGQWQHYIDNQRQLTVYGQLTRLNYDGVQELRDADRYLLGASYSQSFAGTLSPVLTAGLQFGEVEARRSDFTDEFGGEFTVDQFGYEFAGLRVSGQLSLSPSMKLLASARYEHRNYDGKEPSYGLGRSDSQRDYSLALNYTPALFWTIRPEILQTHNRSDLNLYDYSRTQYWLSVRRDFN
ncbi:MAG: surface lipoprotein assembly modifier [Burkholderiaceae bacterium]